jgi:hypothetical protein
MKPLWEWLPGVIIALVMIAAFVVAMIIQHRREKRYWAKVEADSAAYYEAMLNKRASLLAQMKKGGSP